MDVRDRYAPTTCWPCCARSGPKSPRRPAGVRQRIEAVLDYATATRRATGDNPARWSGHLDHLLPKPSARWPVSTMPRSTGARSRRLHGGAGEARGPARTGARVRDPDRRPLGRGQRDAWGEVDDRGRRLDRAGGQRIKASQGASRSRWPRGAWRCSAIRRRARRAWFSRPERPTQAAIGHVADGRAPPHGSTAKRRTASDRRSATGPARRRRSSARGDRGGPGAPAQGQG